MLTALHRGATFRVTDGTSLIANGVLTLRGSFWQKEIFNVSGNATGKGPRGLPLAQEDYFRLSKCPPSPGPALARSDHFGNKMWSGGTGVGLDHLSHDITTSTLSLVKIHSTIWKVSLTQQNRSTTNLTSCSANLLA